LKHYSTLLPITKRREPLLNRMIATKVIGPNAVTATVPETVVEIATGTANDETEARTVALARPTARSM
jgi:hypothetical protein